MSIRVTVGRRPSAKSSCAKGRTARPRRKGLGKRHATVRTLQLEPLELRVLLSADLFDALLSGPRLLTSDRPSSPTIRDFVKLSFASSYWTETANSAPVVPEPATVSTEGAASL